MWAQRTPFQSLRNEVKARMPLYTDDWLTGLRHPGKVLSSSVFMFFVSVFPALTFGNELARSTKLHYGIVEVLLSTTICGGLYAVFSGQPLIIMGVTGPIAAFSASLYNITHSLHWDFLPFMFWTCFWSGLMIISLSIFNLCNDIIASVTRFSCEVFGLLIAFIYILSGIRGVVRRYEGPDPEQMTIFLLVTLNTLVTTVLAVKLSSAQDWWIFTPKIRFYIADWGLSFSVIFTWIIIRLTPPWANVRTRKLPVPTTFHPTSPRPWLINPLDSPPPAIFAALLPAFILTVLLYFDHNVSSLLAQAPHLALRKPPAFNLDFLIVGLAIIVCGLLGLPPAHGLIPQAVLHVESLLHQVHKRTPRQPDQQSCTTLKDWLHTPAALPDLPGPTHHPPEHDAPAASPRCPQEEVQQYVVETRATGLLQSAMIGLILLPAVLGNIRSMPPSLLYGTFLYMGIASFSHNQLWARLLAFTLTQPSFRLPRYLSVHLSPLILTISSRKVLRFTLLQLLCLAAITAITLAGGPSSIAFPVLILVLIPLRHRAFPKWFTNRELEILDSWEAPQLPDEPCASSSTSSGPAPAPSNISGAPSCLHSSSITPGSSTASAPGSLPAALPSHPAAALHQRCTPAAPAPARDTGTGGSEAFGDRGGDV